jgi:hypothetical protein
MKPWFPPLLLLAGAFAAPAQSHLLIIGDSLSKEYDVEGPGIGIDVFPPPSPYPKNWCELLDDRRPDYFDFGDFDVHSDLRAAGHDYNWSVPGSYAEDWREDYLANPPSALVEQLSQTLVKRIVVWLGGNEARESYGPIYNGELDPAAWALQTYGDLAFVLEWVLARRQADVQVVLGNVPHLGATIAKDRDFPFDPVKTGRVTAALEDLNARLAALARDRGIGFADVFGLTRDWVTRGQMSIGGWVVTKRSSSDADADAMFLGDGFHPNMPVQAVFGQAILDAFNARYGTVIPRLTNREIVNSCLEENPDVGFSAWAASYGLPAGEQTAEADPDRDAVSNIVEFGLDLDPARADARLLPQPQSVNQSGQSFLTLTWQPRDPGNAAFCEITAQQSTDPAAWTNLPASAIVSGPPNTRTASVPMAAGQRGWMRLKVRQTGP